MSGLNESIAKVNGFDLNALSANQRGELWTEQISLLYANLTGLVMMIFFSLGYLYCQLNKLGYSGVELNLVKISGDLMTRFIVIGSILIALTIWGLGLVIQLMLEILEEEQ